MPDIDTVLGPVHVDDQGSADEPVVLLWPSLFTDHDMWRHQVPVIRGAGWRTLALDPPGHGRSTGPGRTFTLDECAETVLQVLDALGVSKPVVLLGTSWGGFVALRVAVRTPDRVSGMVVFNTSAERGSRLERARAGLLARLMAIGALDGVTGRMVVAGLLAPATRRSRPEIGAHLVAGLHAWGRRGVVAAVRSVLVDRDAVLDALDEVKTPALVVSGEQDRTLPPVHSERIVGQLPNARHVRVPGAAHLVPLEAPDEANALALDFLSQVPRI